ncbi:MAG TPA: tetratricopeptide repeat protein [Patescibacteria group bacterium]|nr:tetratricopeptide repeat protein [Patescibacteria group bacterium]
MMSPLAPIHHRFLRRFFPPFVALAFALCALSARAQSNLTRVDGRITKEGKSLVGARVVLSQQETFMAFRATTDKYGTFSISDVPRGDYLVSILNATDDVLFRKVLSLTSAPDAPVRLDLEISPAYAAAAVAPANPSTSAPSPAAAPPRSNPPEDPKAAEIGALNRRYIAAQRSGDQKEEIAALKALVAADPTRWDYFEALGDVQLKTEDYEGAAQSYGKGVESAQRFISSTSSDGSVITKSDRDRAKSGMSAMLLSQGNAYLKLKKEAEAIASYTKSAELSPDPATAYYNLCVVHYNARKVEGAIDACDKAIAANPSRADTYFIKGAFLIMSGEKEKDGSMKPPPGAVAALKKYLELAPDGTYAKDVKRLLEYLGAGAEATRRPGKSS